ncbi:hypothetical protein [Microvirga guangxiensis]|nr:hypothetical protein [Microvirga guangxiensis]
MLQTNASDMKPENVRTLIAKDLLGTLVFGSPFKTKVINAKISAPEVDSTRVGEMVSSYCVNAYLENPLFPLHRAISSKVRVYRKDGKAVTISRESPDTHCNGTGFEPFPELEKLSAERYNTP